MNIQHTSALLAATALATSALAAPASRFEEAKFSTVEQQSLRDKQMQDQVVAQQNAVQECIALHAQGKKGEAQKKLAAIVTKNPSMGITADVMRLGWLARDDPKAWEKRVVALAKSGDDHKRNTLGDFTWGEVCSKSGSKATAKKAIKLALNATDHKNVIVLFWATMVYDKTKDYQQGLDSVNKLFKVLPTSRQKNNTYMIKQMKEKRVELESKVKAKN